MFHPPDVVFAGVAVAPIRGGDFAGHAFEIGEVVEPIVTFADYSGWVIPIVVTNAVRRKMDIAQRGFTGMCFVVTDESLPKIFVFGNSGKGLFHDGFGTVPHILEHFTNAAFKGKTHDHKPPL